MSRELPFSEGEGAQVKLVILPGERTGGHKHLMQ